MGSKKSRKQQRNRSFILHADCTAVITPGFLPAFFRPLSSKPMFKFVSDKFIVPQAETFQPRYRH